MSQLVIETDTIKKGVLYFFAVAGIAIVGCWIGMGIMNYCISEAAQLTSAPVVCICHGFRASCGITGTTVPFCH